MIPALGQQAAAQQASTPQQTLKPGELEALVAPVALYPDQLLATVLIASTYPLEVVEAARWQQQNKTLTGTALDSALASQTWDDSVKHLARVPNVLETMDKQISWTQKLGDAFLANQSETMAAVQRLRAKAKAQGTLTDTAQQKVVTENTTIVIEPAEPEKIYVPYYDASSAYGPWDWGYPAYYWPPPYGYGYGRGLAFFTGMAIGAAFWNNNVNWGGGNVVQNNFNNFNNINNRNGQSWRHNADHRRGVNYGNQGLRDRYGRGTQAGANGRRDFRGFGGAGSAGGIGGAGGLGGVGGVGGIGGAGRPGGVGGAGGIGGVGGVGGVGGAGGVGGIGGAGGIGDRGGLGGGNFSNSSFNRGGGFDGLGRGSQTRSFSSRGNSSLGSARSSGFRGGGGGGFRGGGGGGRGGGGRRR